MATRLTQRKGDLAVTQAIASFTRLKYDVSIPITESALYDLIVDDGLSLKKVQVKFTSNNEVDLRRIHSNSKGYVIKKYDQNAFDWLYVLTPESEYLIKFDLTNRTTIKMKDEYLLEGWQSPVDCASLEN